MKKFLLSAISVLLTSGIAFAQQDIGELLFRSVLKMNQYPASPFTGNPINDLVMFFLIPTIFIFLFVGILLSRFDFSNRMKLLFGLAIYLFIIFSGYFSFFALLVGPYLFIMIFIIGTLLFIGWHFRRPGGGGTYKEMGRGGGAATAGVLGGTGVADQLIQKKIQALELEAGLKSARGANDPRTAEFERQLSEIKAEIKILQGKIRYDIIEKARYEKLRHQFRVK